MRACDLAAYYGRAQNVRQHGNDDGECVTTAQNSIEEVQLSD